MAKRKLSVFLSYAAGDVAAAQTLYKRLTAEGWMNVWFAEQRLSPGADKILEIEKAISSSDLAIICISKDATTQAGSFQREFRLILDAAQNMPEGAIFIIPLKLEECEPPFVLRHLQFGNYFENERVNAYVNLLGSLRIRAGQLRINISVSISHNTSTKSNNISIQNKQNTSVDIGRDVNASAVIAGNNNKVTIYNGSDNVNDGLSLPIKPKITTDEITFTVKEDFTATKRDGTNQYAYIEIFNQEDYDLKECYVTLNTLYTNINDEPINILQHINPNISDLAWPIFQAGQEKIIRSHKSARINIAKTLADNIAFTLEDGDHAGLGSWMRTDYYIEIELNGILNSQPIESLIFTGFLHDESKGDFIPDRPPRSYRRLYIEPGKLDKTLYDT